MISVSDKNTDVIPQLVGPAETELRDISNKIVNVEKDIEPVIFTMEEYGSAKTILIAPSEKPPKREVHPELRIGMDPRQTEKRDIVWIEHIFDVYNVQMELHQVAY